MVAYGLSLEAVEKTTEARRRVVAKRRCRKKRKRYGWRRRRPHTSWLQNIVKHFSTAIRPPSTLRHLGHPAHTNLRCNVSVAPNEKPYFCTRESASPVCKSRRGESLFSVLTASSAPRPPARGLLMNSVGVVLS